MAKHKNVTIRVASPNKEGKHKTTLVINGKIVKVVYITATDISGGAVKRLIAQWSKTAEQVALVYKGECATYERKGSEISRVSLVKRTTGGKPRTGKEPTTAQRAKMRAGGAAYRAFYEAQRKAGKTHKQAVAAWKAARRSSGSSAVAVRRTTKPAVVAKPKTAKPINAKAAAGLKAYKTFMAAQKKAGRTHKQALAAWKAKAGTPKKTTGKKPGRKPGRKTTAKKPAAVAAAKTGKKPRKASAYNKFVASFIKAHKGATIKEAAAAWKAQGAGGKPKTAGKPKTGGKKQGRKPKTGGKKPVRAAGKKTTGKKPGKKTTGKRPAARGSLLPDPGAVLGGAALRARR